jgi:hypothetical protein
VNKLSFQCQRLQRLQRLGVFKNGSTPIAGWFMMENTIEMDDDLIWLIVP